MLNIKNLKIFVLLVVLLLNGITLFLPLLNVAGYEISAFNSLILLPAAAFSVIFISKKENKKNSITDFLKRHKSFLLSILIIPFFISILSTLIQGCFLDENLFFYPVITLSGFLFGIMTGFICVLGTKKYRYTALGVTILLLVSISIFEFIFYHQIYFYNPLIGFIPGTIYDEVIIIKSGLILSQIIYLSIAFLSLYVLKNNNKFISPLFLFFLAGFSFIKPGVGLATDKSTISNELSNTISTRHFNIYLPQYVSDKQKKIIAAEHEFYYSELHKETEISVHKKINSFVFSDIEQKGKITGARLADVARIWNYSVYVTIDSYRETIKHELAHIFSGEIANGILNLPGSYNFSLLEGFAMAFENNFDNYPVHYGAALAIQNKSFSGYDFVKNSISFYNNNSRFSYVIAGSFTKYLKDKYGNKKLYLIYNDDDYKKVYGKNFNEIINEYDRFIKAIDVKSIEQEYNRYFTRLPITKKFCVRYVEKKLFEAENLVDEGKLDDAYKIYSFLYDKTLNFHALQGKLICLDKLKKYEQAVKIINDERKKFTGTLYQLPLEFFESEINIKNGNSSKAIDFYNRSFNLKLPKNYLNIISIRKKISKDIVLLEKYVKGSDCDKYQILREIITNEYNDFVVSSLLLLSLSLHTDSEEIDKIFRKHIKQINDIDALQLAEYFLQKKELDKSEYYSDITLSKGDVNFRYDVLNEFNKKIKWIKDNINDIGR